MLKWTFLMSLAHYRTNTVLTVHYTATHRSAANFSLFLFPLLCFSDAALSLSLGGRSANFNSAKTQMGLFLLIAFASQNCVCFSSMFFQRTYFQVDAFYSDQKKAKSQCLCVMWCYLSGIFYVVWILVFLIQRIISKAWPRVGERRVNGCQNALC